MKNCPKKRDDQRVRLTKTLLKNSLMELLKEKDIQNITVKELCEKADVNRGTFYSHYYDIFDLLEELENDLLIEVEELLKDNTVIADPSKGTSFFNGLFKFFEDNKELCTILLGDHGDKKFISKIIQLGKKKAVVEYMEKFPHINITQAELFYTYVASGFLGLIEYWLEKKPDMDPKLLAPMAQSMISQGVSAFINE